MYLLHILRERNDCYNNTILTLLGTEVRKITRREIKPRRAPTNTAFGLCLIAVHGAISSQALQRISPFRTDGAYNT